METLASILWKCDRWNLQVIKSEVKTVFGQTKTLSSKASNSSREIFVRFLFARVGPRFDPQKWRNNRGQQMEASAKQDVMRSGRCDWLLLPLTQQRQQRGGKPRCVQLLCRFLSRENKFGLTCLFLTVNMLFIAHSMRAKRRPTILWNRCLFTFNDY